MSINLLSPKKKEQASNQMLFFTFQYLISVVLISIALIGIILLLTKLIMQNSFNQAVSQNSLVTKEYGQLNQQVRIANEKISLLSTIQKGFVRWSPILIVITELTPANIELSSISVNKQTSDVYINGHAKTRDDLILYKKKLNTSGVISGISLPIESLLQAEDLDFNLNARFIKDL